MTDRKAMQQALEALQTYGAHSANCEHLMLLTSLPPQRKPCSCGLVATIITMRERLAQPERIQLTVRDFVVTVGDIEDAVGTPMYWAEWPNKEQP